MKYSDPIGISIAVAQHILSATCFPAVNVARTVLETVRNFLDLGRIIIRVRVLFIILVILITVLILLLLVLIILNGDLFLDSLRVLIVV